MFHLYKDCIAPSQFMLKGVPTQVLELDNSYLLDRISSIFTEVIPVDGGSRFVKQSRFKYSRYTTDSFKELI